MKLQEYKITLNREQAQLISTALDFYSRINGGQFNEILNRFSWETCNIEDLKKARVILTKLKLLLTGTEENYYTGIDEISENGRNAYDLHQVIRHRLALDSTEHLSPNIVDFREPYQHGTLPLAAIESIK